MSNKPTASPTTATAIPETTAPHSIRLPKSLTFAIWLLALSSLAIAACTIAFLVQAKDFIDATDMRLNALNNNTLGIYAALAGDETVLRGFTGYRVGLVDTRDSTSIRRALYNIMDEIRDVNSS
ncbi:hypothetical protein BJY04DRAFT_220811 [Aspergillus karnatakaensis]|uniref:uncharacterized protein n=1 Tax=Aspergillus karnatakaensis TaxID=1810916 RepID=UPI003CCCC0DC